MLVRYCLINCFNRSLGRREERLLSSSPPLNDFAKSAASCCRSSTSLSLAF